MINNANFDQNRKYIHPNYFLRCRIDLLRQPNVKTTDAAHSESAGWERTNETGVLRYAYLMILRM